MNCIIIHGSPDSPEDKTYNKHWMPWIKKQLISKGIETDIPLMPVPWKPKYNDWKKEFEKLKVNENSILIGHSAGGGFLVRWLGETEKKVKKLILVAPAIIHSGEYKPLEGLLRFDIKNIKDNIKQISIFISDDDSEWIKESARIFHESLSGKLIELNGYGHFTFEDMGTKKFPELLEEVIR